MAAPIKAVEDWIGPFERSFKDEQFLKASYAIHEASGGGSWCKLCDARISGESATRHLARHVKQVEGYRKTKRAQAEERRREALAGTRAERQLERETLGGDAPTRERSSSITPERRAKNRVSTLRYKINHPEKHGKDKWEDRELAEMHNTLEEAVQAAKALEKGAEK